MLAITPVHSVHFPNPLSPFSVTLAVFSLMITPPTNLHHFPLLVIVSLVVPFPTTTFTLIPNSPPLGATSLLFVLHHHEISPRIPTKIQLPTLHSPPRLSPLIAFSINPPPYLFPMLHPLPLVVALPHSIYPLLCH